MADCALALCEKYFESRKTNEPSLVVMNVVGRTRAQKVLAAFNEQKAHEMILLVKDYNKTSYPSSLKLKAKNYFLMMRNFEDVEDIIKFMMALPTWNPLAKFVVLITVAQKPEVPIESNLRKMFETLLKFSILDVNVMYSTTENKNFINSFTWFPYEGHHCGDEVHHIRLINTCESLPTGEVEAKNTTLETFKHRVYIKSMDSIVMDSFFTHLFPKIPKDFHKCLLMVTAEVREPYVEHHDHILFRGLDFLIVKTIADRIHMIPVFKINKHENSLMSEDEMYGYYADILQKYGTLLLMGWLMSRN